MMTSLDLGLMALPDRETRADSSYTDALVNAIVSRVSGGTLATSTGTAALEACAGFVGRCFAAAEVTAPETIRDALDPACMRLIGRALMRRGELVMLMRPTRTRLRLIPGETWDVKGNPDPSSWTYRVTAGGPNRTRTYDDQAGESLLHFTYAVDPEKPWKGHGPLQVAQLGGKLSAEVAAALADEASGPRGGLMETPVDGEDPTVAKLRDEDLPNLKGRIALVEGGDWSDAGNRARTWALTRVGAAPPDALVQLAKLATDEVYAACGLNPAVFRSDGETAAREAYRQALFATVAPLGRLVAAELSAKLEAEITIDWTELRASDVASRARAFQSLVGGGMALEAAARVSGVLNQDE